MNRMVIIILICVMCLNLCFCKKTDETYRYDKKVQLFDKEYEDVEKQITDKYGEYIYLELIKDDSNKSIDFRLILKGTYTQNNKASEDTPVYMIIEDVRVMLNDYMNSNPDCLLTTLLSDYRGHISLTMWVENTHYKLLYEVINGGNFDTGYICEPRFVTYSEIDLSQTPYNIVDEESAIRMFDYFARTGEDIIAVDTAIWNSGMTDDSSDEWRENIYTKFPLVIERYNNSESRSN
ncbi:MAG: hypothetical protein J6U23_02245 [Clostridiales bacterium]|nr:hypothetical protein [Clostridiales bacterium]